VTNFFTISMWVSMTIRAVGDSSSKTGCVKWTMKESSGYSGSRNTMVGSIHHKDLNIHFLCQHLIQKILSPEKKGTWIILAGDLITVADEMLIFWTTYSL
jgi:hypothetical protein